MVKISWDKKPAKKIALLMLIFLFLFSACKREENIDSSLGPNISGMSYEQEYQYLLEKSRGTNTLEKSEHFVPAFTIEKSEHEQVPYIVYKAAVTKPKNDMQNVKISFILHELMALRLSTPTIMYTSSEDDRSIALDPVKINEYVVSLAIPLANAQIDEEFMENFKTIYMNVTWQSKDGTQHQEFLVGQGTPPEDLLTYLNSHKK